MEFNLTNKSLHDELTSSSDKSPIFGTLITAEPRSRAGDSPDAAVKRVKIASSEDEVREAAAGSQRSLGRI